MKPPNNIEDSGPSNAFGNDRTSSDVFGNDLGEFDIWGYESFTNRSQDAARNRMETVLDAAIKVTAAPLGMSDEISREQSLPSYSQKEFVLQGFSPQRPQRARSADGFSHLATPIRVPRKVDDIFFPGSNATRSSSYGTKPSYPVELVPENSTSVKTLQQAPRLSLDWSSLAPPLPLLKQDLVAKRRDLKSVPRPEKNKSESDIQVSNRGPRAPRPEKNRSENDIRASSLNKYDSTFPGFPNFEFPKIAPAKQDLEAKRRSLRSSEHGNRPRRAERKKSDNERRRLSHSDHAPALRRGSLSTGTCLQREARAAKVAVSGSRHSTSDGVVERRSRRRGSLSSSAHGRQRAVQRPDEAKPETPRTTRRSRNQSIPPEWQNSVEVLDAFFSERKLNARKSEDLRKIETANDRSRDRKFSVPPDWHNSVEVLDVFLLGRESKDQEAIEINSIPLRRLAHQEILTSVEVDVKGPFVEIEEVLKTGVKQKNDGDQTTSAAARCSQRRPPRMTRRSAANRHLIEELNNSFELLEEFIERKSSTNNQGISPQVDASPEGGRRRSLSRSRRGGPGRSIKPTKSEQGARRVVSTAPNFATPVRKSKGLKTSNLGNLANAMSSSSTLLDAFLDTNKNANSTEQTNSMKSPTPAKGMQIPDRGSSYDA